MFSAINRTDYISLLINLTISVGLGVLINAIVFGILFADAPEPPSAVSFAPSGAFIGTVWVVLFALMGVARWLLNAFGDAAKSVKNWILILLIFCFIYPFYTLGLSSEKIGLIGNLATIGLTIFVITRTWKFSKIASLMIVPMILWLIIASFITLAELGWIS